MLKNLDLVGCATKRMGNIMNELSLISNLEKGTHE